MSRIPYPYENDAERLQALSNRIRPERQPGGASTWLLYPRRDLILDWSPVDVFSLLSHMEAVHGEV